MSHYPTSAEDPRLRALQIRDWLDDLASFPASAVAAACAEWRRTKAHRPTPADIRALCGRPPVPAPAERYWNTPEWRRSVFAAEKAEADRRLAEAHETREQWARERGFANFADALKFGLVAASGRKATDAR